MAAIKLTQKKKAAFIPSVVPAALAAASIILPKVVEKRNLWAWWDEKVCECGCRMRSDGELRWCSSSACLRCEKLGK